MPTISELISMQEEFQKPRGLNEINDPITAFDRMMDEVWELSEELINDNPEKALDELVDVFILGSAIALALLKKTNGNVEDFDQRVRDKFERNKLKYAPEFFYNYDPVSAMRVAKHWWDLELDDGTWHNEEDF